MCLFGRDLFLLKEVDWYVPGRGKLRYSILPFGVAIFGFRKIDILILVHQIAILRFENSISILENFASDIPIQQP